MFSYQRRDTDETFLDSKQASVLVSLSFFILPFFDIEKIGNLNCSWKKGKKAKKS